MRTYKFDCILKENCTFEASYEFHRIQADTLAQLKRKALILINGLYGEKQFILVFDVKPFVFKADILDM